MLQTHPTKMLAVFLAVLMIRPFPTQAATSAAVLGSISTYGAVSVGAVSAPAESTLFAGDLVNTQTGNAVVQYKQGSRVVLAADSSAQFSANQIELQKGHMTFRSAAEGGPVFNATSLRLEPGAANSAANVVVDSGKATVSVTEGVLQVIDPTGAKLASIKAGETKLFAMASPAPAAAAPAAPAPAAIGGVPVWGVVLAVGAIIATTVTAIELNNNASDNAAALSPSH